MTEQQQEYLVCSNCGRKFHASGVYALHLTGSALVRRCCTDAELRKLGMAKSALGYWVMSQRKRWLAPGLDS